MNTINFEDLINHTNDFFNKFWNIQSEIPPTWSEPWDLNSEIPNNRRKGCYAIFEGEELVFADLTIKQTFNPHNTTTILSHRHFEDS
jgi:hypothetical protein